MTINNSQAIEKCNEVNNTSNVETMNQNGEKEATSNATEIINEANDASSNEPTNNNTNMVEKGKVTTSNVMESENATTVASEKENKRTSYRTVNAVIDGKRKKIILAYSKYSMEQPKDKQNLKGKIDPNKLLPVIFNLAEAKIFWDENIELFDANGIFIPKGTPDTYKLCEQGSTFARAQIDEVLENVRINHFKSVADYAQAIGNSELFSRAMNNVEKIGCAVLATGDKAYRAVHEFAKEFNITSNSSQLYLDIKLSPITTSMMTMGYKPEVAPVLGRSPEDAKRLFNQACRTFGKSAKNRYIPRVVNTLLRDERYNLDVLIEAMLIIPAEEIATMLEMDCGNKESCISSYLTRWLERAIENGLIKTAA